MRSQVYNLSNLKYKQHNITVEGKNMGYRYTDSEIKKIMKNFEIVIDTREKMGVHINEYLAIKKVPFIIQKLDTGDYSARIRAIPELGIIKDLYIDAKVERKADWSEIAGNLQKRTETAFVNELIRSADKPFTILIEDPNGYHNLLNGNYHSSYKPESLLGRMNSFKAKYNFEIVYLDKKYSPNWILYHLKYQAIHQLKNMDIQIYLPEPSE